MAPPTVIDLSLSTDDEGALPTSSKRAEAVAMTAKGRGDSAYLSIIDDGHKDVDDLVGRPSKRRKSSDSNTVRSQRLAVHKNPSFPRESLKRASLTNKALGGVDDFALSDDIVFTSSAHAAAVVSTTTDGGHALDEQGYSDDSLPEDLFMTRPKSPQHAPFTGRTAALLANLKKPPMIKKLSVKSVSASLVPSRDTSKVPQARSGGALDIASSEEDISARSKTKKKPKFTDEEKALRLQEREEAKLERAAQKANDKEDEKQRKQILREEKAREKQRAADLTEVNKARKNKKETAKEMIVDLPLSIEGQRVEDQIKEFLKSLDIECGSYQSPISHIIRWRRKVDSYFDEDKGYRISMPQEIRSEKHILCLISAKDFIALVTADSADSHSETLENHIRKIRMKFGGCIPIYLIEGFNAWMRKNRNNRNKEYQAAVLNQDRLDGPNQQPASRRKKVPKAYIDEDLIEDAMLQLQVLNNCLVHHTATPFETAEWVANFTQHISLIPYK